MDPPHERDEALPMFDDVRRHVIYRLANAPIFQFPFPHIVVDEILPRAFYARLRGMLPEDRSFAMSAHPGRSVLTPEGLARAGLDAERAAFWQSMFATMMHDDIGAWIMAKFYDVVSARFGLDQPGGGVSLRSSTSLVRDREGFSMFPHTDLPNKVISTLVYLPADSERPELGTAFYAPRDPQLECPGGRYHDPSLFDHVATIPFQPNTLLAFPKTPACFHGVEPGLGAGERRDVLLFDLDVPE
jgi:hypothetical protein